MMKQLLYRISLTLFMSIFFIAFSTFHVQASQTDASYVSAQHSADTGTIHIPIPDSSQFEEDYGYIDPCIKIESIEDESSPYELYRTTTIPVSYDLRNVSGLNYITSVKNQNPYGSCWAFSSIASAESNLIMKSLSNPSLDLSEYHLAYFNYHPVIDPLNGTSGDGVSLSTSNNNSYLDIGGNAFMSTFTLSKWSGTANESSAPYPGYSTPVALNNNLAYDSSFHLSNVYWVSMKDHYTIKKLIMEQGAISTSYAHYDNPNYLNTYTNSYYNYDSTSSNHAITIIGWDDSYPATNFNTQPASNGAWLVKNSWGSTFGDSGYFWISYEDTSLNAGNAFSFIMDNKDNFDYNYQYDGGILPAYLPFTSNCMLSNVFTINGNSGESELLEAVSIVLGSVNTNYSIQIYKNPTDSSNPTTGTPMLDIPQTGTLTYAGFHTISLNNPITFFSGEKFAVMITLEKPGEDIFVYVDTNYTQLVNGINLIYTSSASAGQSLVNYSGHSNWEDISLNGNNLRIKAFTSVGSLAKKNISNTIINPIENQKHTGKNITPTVSITDDSYILKEDIDYSITFSNNKNVGTASATITGIGNYTGTKTITFKIVSADIPVDNVSAFVTRLYEKILLRKPDTSGLNYHTNRLKDKLSTGSDIARGFVFSTEFYKRNLSNTEYIKVLYQSFMDRNADAAGLNYWRNMLDNGVSREYVFKGFVLSNEFKSICNSYSILSGDIILTEPRDQNANLTMFISRCYEKALGRNAEFSGLNYYAEEILSKRVTPLQASQNFIFSPEFKNKNLSDIDYVKVLYRTFMGREFDQSGLNYHLNRMKNGTSREEILLGFAYSPEFKNIMSSFGL